MIIDALKTNKELWETYRPAVEKKSIFA